MAARLFVSSSTTDADLFCVLRVLRPGGEEVTFPGAIDPYTPVAQGWLRLSHRKLDPELSTPCRPYHSHDDIQPLTPGEIYQADVEIWPTSVVLPPGYRVALTIRGRDDEVRRPRGAPAGLVQERDDRLRPVPPRRPRGPPAGPRRQHANPLARSRPGVYLLLPVIPDG